MGWERLAHAEITGSAAVLDSGAFTAKKHLKEIISGSVVSGSMAITFNGVAPEDARYPYKTSDDHASSFGGAGAQPAIPITDNADHSYCVLEIFNVAGVEKQLIGKTLSSATGASNAPVNREILAKWTETTAQITSVKITNNSGGALNCNVGSFITVLGAKEAATATSVTTDTFAAKKHLMIQAYAKGGNGIAFQFNGDTGNNYTQRYSSLGAADGTQTSRGDFWCYYDGNDVNKFATVNIINEATKEKLIIAESVSVATTGAGTAPLRTEAVGKWANTSNAITSVTLKQFTTNGLEEGSEIVVYGTD